MQLKCLSSPAEVRVEQDTKCNHVSGSLRLDYLLLSFIYYCSRPRLLFVVIVVFLRQFFGDEGCC